MKRNKPSKDIPDRPVLKFLRDIMSEGYRCVGWHDLQPRDKYCPTVLDAMPPGTTEKLAHSKMQSLIDRGLVDGCCCGCRGDYELTDEGHQQLSRDDPAAHPR